MTTTIIIGVVLWLGLSYLGRILCTWGDDMCVYTPFGIFFSSLIRSFGKTLRVSSFLVGCGYILWGLL